MTDDERLVVDALQRSGGSVQEQRLVGAFEEFAPGEGIAVLSSEGGPYRGRDQVAGFFARIDPAPVRYGWEWRSVDVHVDGDHAWFLADGDELIDDKGGHGSACRTG